MVTPYLVLKCVSDVQAYFVKSCEYCLDLSKNSYLFEFLCVRWI